MSRDPQQAQVLVPVDFSEASQRAMAWAFDYAQRADCHVHLMHVLERRLYASDFSSRNLDDLRAELETIEASARSELELMAPSAAQREAIGTITRHMANGHPANEIVAVADRIGADLIVMGTRGKSALRRALVGSVTERVVRTAPCTVVCVKQTTSEQP